MTLSLPCDTFRLLMAGGSVFALGIIVVWMWIPALVIIPSITLIMLYISLFWNRHAAIKFHSNRNGKFATSVGAVAAYLESRINEEETRLLSDKSPLVALGKRLEGLASKATALHHEILGRVARQGKAAPEWLRDSVADAEGVVAGLMSDLGRLREHCDKLRAFFAAARAEVKNLFDPRSDINLVQQLSELRAAAEASRKEVSRVMIESTVGLNNRLLHLASELQEMIAETGVEVAASLPDTGDFNRDMRRIEQVVQAYNERAAKLNLALTGGVA